MSLQTTQPICLASSSPRRQELLKQYGLPFTIQKPDVDETPRLNEDPKAYVQRLAQEKAQVIANSLEDHLVLAGDTIVVHENQILGKPTSPQDALHMLQQLNGQTHEVYSGYAVVNTSSSQSIVGYESTRVQLRRVPETLLQWYVNTQEPMDKAGSYSIQGQGGLLVEGIVGSYNNVVGFPIESILWKMQEHRWVDWE